MNRFYQQMDSKTRITHLGPVDVPIAENPGFATGIPGYTLMASTIETQLKASTLHQLPAGIQCGEGYTSCAFSGVQTVAA